MKKDIALANQQPTDFKFTPESVQQAKQEIAKYPVGRQKSAVMSLLTLAQNQHQGWIPTAAMDYIASLLAIKPIEVYEVASFYSMYFLAPRGKYLIQVCRTTPCWLCKSDSVLQACKDFLKIDIGQTTEDNMFTLIEVECLGACVNAPVVQINTQYYENLDEDKIISILSELQEN